MSLVSRGWAGLKSFRLGNGIRFRVVVLALIAAVPFVWYRISDIRSGEVENLALIRDEAIRAAARGADRQAEVFAEIRTLLSVTAKVPAVLSASASECAAFLGSVRETRYWAKNLFVTDASGNVVCSTEPRSLGNNIGDRSYFTDAVASGKFGVSDFITSRIDGQPILAAAYPVYAADGSLRNVIVSSIKLFLLNREIGDIGRALSARILVVDGAGKVLGRYPEDGNTPLGVIDPRSVTAVGNQGAGWFEWRDTDGVRRLYGVSPLPDTQARFAIGFSIEAALADTYAKIRAAYINAAAIGAAIILLAWLFGEYYFLRPLRSLIGTTRRLTEGDLTARASVAGAAAEFRELGTSFNAMADRLAMLATSDSLTGVANRRRFEQYLDEEWRRAIRAGNTMALALLDIDGFKQFNDRHGHQIGDHCLKLVATELTRFARRSEDLLGRYGGEEFVIGMPGMTEGDAFRHCERMRTAIAALSLEDIGLPVGAITISVGVAVMVPGPGSTADVLVAMADAALYDAKRAGRNRVALYRDGPAAGTIHVA